jgi:Ser-tRNA(Ala) deacylase AlaX
MTKKLFYENPYEKEFDAEVVEVKDNGIILDQTYFYPEGGGQPGDTGEISGVKVLDTKNEGNGVLHILEEQKFKVGDKVHGKIDWERRFKLMRLHTAAHIVYEIFTEKFGKQKIIGSNISPDKSRIDFEYPEKLELAEVESEANKAISSGLEVQTEDDQEKEGFRWWKAGSWKMPCGGTHVKNTSEIGGIKLKRNNIGAGKERIEITLL